MTPVEALWIPACRSRGWLGDRNVPSPGISAVLRALADHGPTYGSAVARLAAQNQANVTAVWLPKLVRLGFVERGEEEAGLGHQGGGRPAVFWALTGPGWALVRALAECEVAA